MYITFNSLFSFKKALNGFDSLNARYDNDFSIINHCHLWPNDIGYNNMAIKTSCKLCCLISAKIYSLMCETCSKSSYPVIVSSLKIFSLMFQHFLEKGRNQFVQKYFNYMITQLRINVGYQKPWNTDLSSCYEVDRRCIVNR